MGLEINTWRDPYDAGFSPTTPRKIELNPGVTVLVGCNGAGKTTLLRNIEEEAKINKIPCHLYDNIADGGTSDVFGMLTDSFTSFECDDKTLGATMFSSSEGEVIKLNIGRQSTLYKEFLQTGLFKDRRTRLSLLFTKDEDKKDVATNVRILLFDATDSGLSIDAVCEIKKLFSFILDDAKELGVELYILISANEYEMARGENCFDVNKGQYLQFSDYEDYRAFILNSRKLKEKRLEKQQVWFEKQKLKEAEKFEKLKVSVYQNIEKIKAKYTLSNNDMSYRGKYLIEDEMEKLKRFAREAKYNTFKV